MYSLRTSINFFNNYIFVFKASYFFDFLDAFTIENTINNTIMSKN